MHIHVNLLGTIFLLFLAKVKAQKFIIAPLLLAVLVLRPSHCPPFTPVPAVNSLRISWQT